MKFVLFEINLDDKLFELLLKLGVDGSVDDVENGCIIRKNAIS